MAQERSKDSCLLENESQEDSTIITVLKNKVSASIVVIRKKKMLVFHITASLLQCFDSSDVNLVVLAFHLFFR